MRKGEKTSLASRVLKNRRTLAAGLSAMADGFLRESEPGMGTGLSAFLARGEALPDLRIVMVLAVRRAERRLESLIAAGERLKDPAFTWPEGTPIRVAVEPGELAAEFEGLAGELRAGVDRLERKVNDSDAVLESEARPPSDPLLFSGARYRLKKCRC